MIPKGIHFQIQGRRGLPGVLPMIFMAVIAAGVIAFLVFFGLAIAVIGLGVSACAALYYGIRRKLTGTTHRSSPLNDQVHRETPRPDVKVIEVESVRVD
jgi:membrane protein implicated in regulation of membrane protease activity